MENASAVTSFILVAYTALEDHRYVYFLCFLLLYIIILFANSVVISVIYIERSLREPMYLFLCNLAVNGVYGSTCLLPSLLVNLSSHNYEISVTCCLIQIFCLHSYGAVDFTILAVMSYDRYVAICHPLHYHVLMSQRKLYAAIALSWVYPFIYFILNAIVTAQYLFCDRILEKVHCTNFPVVRLSCFDTTIYSIVGMGLLVVLPCPQILMILFSYTQILRICLASKDSQMKAIQTCTPHLLSVINYTVGCLFELIQSRFNMSYVPYTVRIFLSLYFLIMSPLFNPVIYGMGLQAVRVQIFRLFGRK